MPLGENLSKTITNMGKDGEKQDNTWQHYTHEIRPNDPITPEVVEKPKKKTRPKAKKEKAIEDAISKDLRTRNIHYPQ